MADQVAPEYAFTIVVPVANPETASDLLHLAAGLVDPEEGRLIAVAVALGDPEEDAKTFDKLEPICERMTDEGYNVEFVTRNSTSAARGILDTVREYGADMLVMGIRQRRRGELVLGSVLENVLIAAPCDVVIYRAGSSPDFERIMVPIDDYSHVRVASRMGIWLGKRYNTSVEAVYVRRPHQSEFEALAHIEQALSGLPGSRDVKRSVIRANDAVKAITTRAQASDMIVIGFDERSDLERWLFGDVVYRGVMNTSPGPVLLVSRSRSSISTPQRIGRRIIGWLRPVLTRAEQEDLIRQSQIAAGTTLDYMVLSVISAVLASLGLLLNSAAVIIGAMLVAPLMQPLIALSVGLSSGRLVMARRGMFSLTVGVLVALLMSVLIGSLNPIGEPTREMLVRGTPSLLDAFVALASGVVGAYATARKDIPAALAGVAIAAALMPPLCTVGLAFALGLMNLAIGSALLFLTNILFIILSATIVFFYVGLTNQVTEAPLSRQLLSLGLIAVLAIFVVFEISQLNNRVTDEMIVREELARTLTSAEVIELDIDLTDDQPRVSAIVRYERFLSDRAIREAQLSIAAALNRPVTLEIVGQRFTRITPLVEPPEETTEEAQITASSD
jgi:uncharacterized hydrophobic protein (TIGR00271 family)